MKTTLDLTADIIDIRDIIERIEELEDEIALALDQGDTEAMQVYEHERDELNVIMADLKGAGGDEQWRGDWYPITLIRESYFRAYAEELAVDCGMVNSQASWPNNCIDWEQAARELKHDYSATTIDGCTYYFR